MAAFVTSWRLLSVAPTRIVGLSWRHGRREVDCGTYSARRLMGSGMAYDARLVVQVAAAALGAAPARRLGAVAAACGVSRHTLVRACLKVGAGSARDLRDAVLHRRMHALMTAAPPETIKEISDRAGLLDAAVVRAMAEARRRRGPDGRCARRSVGGSRLRPIWAGCRGRDAAPGSTWGCLAWLTSRGRTCPLPAGAGGC